MRLAHLTVVGQHLVVLAPALDDASDDGTVADGHLAPRDRPAVTGLQQTLPLFEPEESPRTGPQAVDPREEQARRLAGTVARTLLETLQGRRPLPQLGSWADEQPQAVAGAWQRRRSWARVQLVGVRACLVTARVVEATALFDEEGMHLSAVLRLEHRQGRWVLADFDVLLPAALQRRATRAG